MKKNSITIKQSIFINKPREIVWDYTQNYDNRTKWDDSILEAKVLETSPTRTVQLKAKGNTTMIFVYKLEDRPHKTSLAAREIQSSMMEGGGGSWVYEEQNGGTLWTQTNTIVFKQGFFLSLLNPFFKWAFNGQTKKAMEKAKKIIEQII